MKTKLALLLIVNIACALSLHAQSRVDSLMQIYDFATAAKVLQRQISQAAGAGEPVAALEECLRKAEMGERMLQATEKVVFLDSVVMPADEVLTKLRLTPHAGKLMAIGDFFPEGLPNGFVGQGTMYVGDYADRVFLAQPDSNGLSKLHSARLLAGRWTAPQPLPGLENAADIQDYPFAMPDGQTIYFAAQGPQSLGGYDIFVTRYDADAGHYLKPAHLGFPFNSTANDYLYVVDEAAGVGYFITDRNQAPGEVCLYAFIPNSSHDIYLLNGENTDTVRRAARIASINELGAGSEQAIATRRAANKLLSQSQQQSDTPILIVIDDTHVYTNPSQLKSTTAARIATEYIARQRELKEIETRLSAARENYAASHDEHVAQQIINLEEHEENLRAAIHRMAKNMRQAELSQ